MNVSRLAGAVCTLTLPLLGIACGKGVREPVERPILFSESRDGNMDVFTVSPATGKTTQVTNDPAYDGYASWSHDGSKIAFASKRAGGNFEIFVANADGTAARQLTNMGFDSAPAWSPDGKKIAFSSMTAYGYDMFVMDADGSNQTRVTDVSGRNELCGNWSPDGSLIVFGSDMDDHWHIYTIKPDGTELKKLTDGDFDDYLPRFSPTGSRVAFTSDRDGVHEIYVMNSDGTGVTRVTFGDENGTYRDVQPTWSADETEIVYQRSALIGSQTNELYSIRLVASATRVGDPRNAATRISSGGFPSWYP